MRKLPSGACEPNGQAVGIELAKTAMRRRANQRDDEAIKHWKEETWPQLKKMT